MAVSTYAAFLSLLAFVSCQNDALPPPPAPIKLPADPVNTVSPPREIVSTPPVADVPLARILKDNLLKNLPRDIVVQKDHDWGHQAHVPSIQGVRRIEVLRNHGNWEKMKVICRDVPHRLQLVIDNALYAGEDRMSFAVHLDVPADVEFDKQTWQNGLQIFVGRSRARVSFRIDLVMEGGPATQDGSGFKLFRARVGSYDFVSEHVNGVGGDLARMFGGSFQHTFQQYQARFEHDIEGKIRNAILKASSSPDVAESWQRLIKALSSQTYQTPNRLTTALPAEPLPEGPIGYVTLGPSPVVIMPACSGASVSIDLLLNGHRAAASQHEPPAIHAAPAHSGSSPYSGFSMSFGSSSHAEHGESSSHSSTEHGGGHRR